MITVEKLAEMLQKHPRQGDEILFDVKRVSESQDFAKLVDIYWDNGELILVFG